LSRLRPEERALEIDRSLATVQDLTGAPCRLFSYPNGRPQDYDADTVGALHERGIRAAVTTVAGPNDQTTPVLELRRFGVGAGLQMARFQLMAHHAAE
jgi:peptidoglycan/xylan/chitin deacetylase (PgdA/CDA1 family)